MEYERHIKASRKKNKNKRYMNIATQNVHGINEEGEEESMKYNREQRFGVEFLVKDTQEINPTKMAQD